MQIFNWSTTIPQETFSSPQFKMDWTIVESAFMVPDYNIPSQQYGKDQDTLDYNIAIRNKWAGSATYAVMQSNGNESINDSTQTLVTNLGTKFTSDTSMFWTSNRITITTAGVYFLSAMIRYQASTVGFYQCIITKNWSGNTIWIGIVSPTGAGAQMCFASCYDSASAWDYYELYAYHTHWSAVNVWGTWMYLGINWV